MSLKRKAGSEEDPSSDRGPGVDAEHDVFRSRPIEDRSSTFIGYFSPRLKPKELQKLSEASSASHKILAWRRESNQQSINKQKQYVSGFDDDGEKYGGKKIERALESAQVEGACVVARWYGGVLLGPVRFTHIETCAMEAIRAWQEHHQLLDRKRRKVEQDAEEHAALVKSLAERDQSILILRRLAAEKEQLSKKSQEASNESASSAENNSSAKFPVVSNTASVEVDYAVLKLERLKVLEKARDATLAFLLKRIENAENKLAVMESEVGSSSQ